MTLVRAGNRFGALGDWISPPRHDGSVATLAGRRFYGTRVAAVDGDGNETSGIRLPPIAVPLATYTGWNLYARLPSELCDRDGSYIPFAKTKAERDAANDPRPSIEERYGSRADYVAKVRAAADAAGARPAAVAGRCGRLCARRGGERPLLNSTRYLILLASRITSASTMARPTSACG